jgi:hypothetical protein
MDPKESFTITDTTKEVVIIHKQGLNEKSAPDIEVTGAIDAPYRWIQKKTSGFNASNIIIDDSFISVCRDQATITLFQNISDPHTKRKVTGKLEYTESFMKWGFNTQKYQTCNSLAEFVKMNRSCFESREIADRLVVSLKNLKMKVEKEKESSNDNKGSALEMIGQRVISSTIPDDITVTMRMFTGQAPVTFKVELYVHPSTFDVCLISPEAKELEDLVVNSAIDEQVFAINDFAPMIPIIEK